MPSRGPQTDTDTHIHIHCQIQRRPYLHICTNIYIGRGFPLVPPPFFHSSNRTKTIELLALKPITLVDSSNPPSMSCVLTLCWGLWTRQKWYIQMVFRPSSLASKRKPRPAHVGVPKWGAWAERDTVPSCVRFLFSNLPNSEKRLE